MKQLDHSLKSLMLLSALLVSTGFHLNVSGQSFPTGFSQVTVANGISNPTAMAFAPDGRIFVAQQGGSLIVIENDIKLSTPAIQLSVNSSGERGLIGIALHPQFSTNGFVYLYYTLPNGSHNRVSRFTMNGNVINPSTEVIILNLDPLSNATNHNGGAMHFKGDKLYIAIGENANGSHAQNLDTYHGKLLRVNDDGSTPADNPFNTAGASQQRRRVWSYGLRNPFTFDVQPSTGNVFVNDVGQNTWEEINNATAGGLNFGWPATEGATTNPSYTSPVFSYQHGSGDGRGCAITGGVFFNPTSTNYPASYTGKYFYQDLCNNWINYLDLTSGATRNAFATGLPGQSLALDVGTDGNLYYLSRSAGSLIRVIYTNTQAPAITDQPDNVTVSQGQPASFSVTASGATPLNYQWQKNSVNIPGATSSQYTIASAQPSDAGNYRVVVSNSAGSVTSNSATLAVTAFNGAPTASITTPVSGAMYRGGDVISFSGTGTDPEDGTLPPGAFTWTVIFHHADHVHDGPPVAQGTTSGTFTIPNSGETAVDVFYRLYLVVGDSQGLTDTTFVDIDPYTSSITLDSDPQGLTLTLDGQPVVTPFTTLGVEGIQRTIGVVSPQTLNNTTYEFESWDHGGNSTQTISTPQANTTYTANFSPSASGLPDPWVSTDIGNVALSGSASFNNGTFTLQASGNDIWNTSDAFHFVYQPVSGDVEIIARVNSITNSNAWAKTGIMIRETLAANSKHAMTVVTPGNNTAFQRRVNTGGSSTHTAGSGSAPYWVRLVRTGNVFTGWVSSNGSNWTQVGSATISMAANVFVGLPLTSHNNSVLVTGVISNVSVQGATPDPIVSGATYRITAVHSGLSMDLASTSTSNGVNVLQSNYTGEGKQHWVAEDQGNGFFKLVNDFSAKALDISGVSSSDGANVIQWTSHSGFNQQFNLNDVGGGNYEIVARHSGKCVEVAGSSTANGGNIQQSTCTGNNNQLWRFEEVVGSSNVLSSEAGYRRGLSVYPNPLAEEHFTVSAEVDELTDIHLQVVNLFGQVVYERSFENQESGKMDHAVDLPLRPGTYVVKVLTRYNSRQTVLIKK